MDVSADSKKCPEQGFDIGSISELRDQARRGGVRLPGHAFPVAGENRVEVSHDLRKLLRSNDRILIGKRLCRIRGTRHEAVAKESFKLRFCWLGEDVFKESLEHRGGLCVYRIPPQARTGKMWTTFGRMVYENQLTQGLIKRYRGFHIVFGQRQKVLAKRLRPWLPRLADQLKKWSKHHDQLQERIKWWTWDWQVVLEARQRKAEQEVVQQGMSMEVREALRDEERKNAYMGLVPKIQTTWDSIEGDGKLAWKNTKTGDVTANKPKELKSANEIAHEEAKARIKKKQGGKNGK